MEEDTRDLKALTALRRAELSKNSVRCRHTDLTIMQTDVSIVDALVEEYMLQEELTDKACLV